MSIPWRSPWRVVQGQAFERFLHETTWGLGHALETFCGWWVLGNGQPSVVIVNEGAEAAEVVLETL